MALPPSTITAIEREPRLRGRQRTSILLGQPERRDRDRYAESLRRLGFETIAVPTAHEALPVASRVDIVVTGLLLPGAMDGIALVAQLKSDERTRRIPVIALTRCAWNRERERAFDVGCDLFLAKPCPPRLLARTILSFRAAIANRQH